MNLQFINYNSIHYGAMDCSERLQQTLAWKISAVFSLFICCDLSFKDALKVELFRFVSQSLLI